MQIERYSLTYLHNIETKDKREDCRNNQYMRGYVKATLRLKDCGNGEQNKICLFLI